MGTQITIIVNYDFILNSNLTPSNGLKLPKFICKTIAKSELIISYNAFDKLLEETDKMWY